VITDKDLWEYKHAPKKFDDLILNEDIKLKLKKSLDEIPNMMLYGIHGIGKSAYTNILLDHTGARKNGYLWINGSDETGIDAARSTIKSFAYAFSPHIKVVVLNEGDSLTKGDQGAQKMLKELIENVVDHCRFILITNHPHKIENELKSRFRMIKFDNPPKIDIYKYCEKILKSEKVRYKKKTILSIINKCYPDIRKTISVLQENTIDNVLANDYVFSDEKIFREILDTMKIDPDNSVPKIRRILKNNYIPYTELYNFLYKNCEEFKQPGLAILTIGQHLYWNSTIANKEINFMHMLIEMLNMGIL
jgi:DNA polymerase III delta prime subunit